MYVLVFDDHVYNCVDAWITQVGLLIYLKIMENDS